MIAALEGKIDYLAEKYIVLNTGKISFKIFAVKSVFDSVAEKNNNIKVFTHLLVRDDAMELYGFSTKEELDFFEILISVSGVGPKIALAILSEFEMNRLKNAIFSGKYKALIMPGVGKKTAQKIIIDLQNKIDKAGMEEADIKTLKIEEDVVDALLSLGYKKREIEGAVRFIPQELNTTKEKIKHVLGVLGQNKRP